MKTEFKLLSRVAKDSLKEKIPELPVMCDYESTPMGFQKREPFISDKHTCNFCQGKEHYLPYFDPNTSMQRCWLCANTDCFVYNQRSCKPLCDGNSPKQRSLLWQSFTELNDLGDEYENVVFEKIEQSQGKIDYMKKFVANPHGIIHMQGKPGTGKTYSALGMCELFTRTDKSAIFIKQEKLANQWVNNKDVDFINKFKSVTLLVIDDFGTGIIPDKFMTFFLDLIDSRMQWKRKGTVITTNLQEDKLSVLCGDALTDRLRTAQYFIFNDDSRRSKQVL